MHPTEAIMVFFNSEYKPLAASSRNPQTTRIKFARALSICLGDRVEECHDISGASELSAPLSWLPPCGTRFGCNPLCRGMYTRLAILNTAWQIAELNNNVDIVLHLLLHIDSHMPALIAWQLSCDENEQCSEELLQRILVNFSPDLKYAFSHHNVPNLSALLPLAFTYNNSDHSNMRAVRQQFPRMSPYNQEIVMILVNLLYKYTPQRCANREGKTVAAKSATMSERCEEVIYKIMIASWLGVYPWCKKRMDIKSRILIYHSFHVTVDFSEIFEKRMSLIVLYMGKEYFWYMLTQNKFMIDVLHNKYNFDKYFEYTSKVNEIMREHVSTALQGCDYSPSSISGLFGGCCAAVSELHEKYRIHQTETTVDYNINRIVRECIDYSLTTYACDIIEPIYGRECTMPNPVPRVSNDVEQLMKDVISRFPMQSSVPMDWLVYIGNVNSMHVDLMARSVYAKIPDLKRAIASLPVDVYAIFVTFFRLCQERCVYRECMGDIDMYNYHLASLASYHGVREDGKLFPVSGQIMVCPNCKDQKFNCVYPKINRNKNSNGVSKVSTTSQGKMICGCRQKPVAWQKTAESDTVTTEKDMPSQTASTKNRSLAKSVYMHQFKEACQQSELITVNVRGRLAYFNGAWFIGCYICMRVIEFGSARYKDNIYMCELCYDDRALNATQRSEACALCKQQTYDETSISMFLFDDLPETHPENRRYRLFRFCRSHGNYDWVHNYQAVPLLSLVIEGLKKKWGMYDNIQKRMIMPYENVDNEERHADN
jgi:hypothetical protein